MEANNDLYTIEKAKESQLFEILSFLHENFDKEETMLTSMRNSNTISAEEEELIRTDHARLIRAMFVFSPCLVALEKSSKKIIGVNLMTVSKNPKFSDNVDGVSAVFTNNPPRSRLMKQYFDYLSIISEKAELYERFPDAKTAVEFYAIAVDKSYRGKGLATALMGAGISFAKTSIQDVAFIFGVYTSLYSKKAAEKLGLKTVMDVDLLTYKNDKGEPIFQDTSPHNIVSVMLLQT